MASAVNGLYGSSNTDNTSGSSALGSKPPSEAMFLQLLVAQLQNQDPLNPADSTQFVAQLAQFSELEQVIGIRSDVSKLATAATATPTTGTTQTQA